jgi:hypothetical protein
MLIEDLQLLLNRRMRTRMYGGVGAAVSNGGGYPIIGKSDSASLVRGHHATTSDEYCMRSSPFELGRHLCCR